jgi:hypothetical protein
MSMIELSQYELLQVSGGAGLEGNNNTGEADGPNNDGSFVDTTGAQNAV